MILDPGLAIVSFIAIAFAVLLGMSIWAIVDASSHSKEDFRSAGSSKTSWIIVITICTMFSGLGSFIAIYYLLGVRPKILTVEGQGIRTGTPLL